MFFSASLRFAHYKEDFHKQKNVDFCVKIRWILILKIILRRIAGLYVFSFHGKLEIQLMHYRIEKHNIFHKNIDFSRLPITASISDRSKSLFMPPYGLLEIGLPDNETQELTTSANRFGFFKNDQNGHLRGILVGSNWSIRCWL